jgi:hypothetical protein
VNVVSLRASKLSTGVNSWASEQVKSAGTSGGRALNEIWLPLDAEINCARDTLTATTNRARRLIRGRKNMMVLLKGAMWTMVLLMK